MNFQHAPIHHSHVPILPRVTELFAVIKSADEELAQIRKDCTHPSYTIGWWEYGMGRIQAQRICHRCRTTVEGITDEERKQLELFRGASTWTISSVGG